MSSQVKGTVYYGREVLVARRQAAGYIVSIVRKQWDESSAAASFFQTQPRIQTQRMVGLYISIDLIKIPPPRFVQRLVS